MWNYAALVARDPEYAASTRTPMSNKCFESFMHAYMQYPVYDDGMSAGLLCGTTAFASFSLLFFSPGAKYSNPPLLLLLLLRQ